MTTAIQKQLAGIEDLLIGLAPVTQDRGGVNYTIHALNAVTLADALSITDIATLRTMIPTSLSQVNVQYHTLLNKGGGGNFYGVTGVPPGTYVDNNCSVIVPTGTGGSAAWLRLDVGYITPEMAGAIGDGIVDDTAAINTAHLVHPLCFMAASTYRIDSSLIPQPGHAILGTKNTWIYQYGAFAWQNSAIDLLDWVLDGISFKLMSGSINPYDCVFSLGAHRRCIIRNIYCWNYKIGRAHV